MSYLALTDVLAERHRQDSKWGVQNCPATEWMSILGEEFGELCKEVNELGPDRAQNVPRPS